MSSQNVLVEFKVQSFTCNLCPQPSSYGTGKMFFTRPVLRLMKIVLIFRLYGEFKSFLYIVYLLRISVLSFWRINVYSVDSRFSCIDLVVVSLVTPILVLSLDPANLGQGCEERKSRAAESQFLVIACRRQFGRLNIVVHLVHKINRY